MPNESQTALITGGTSGIGLATANTAQAPAGGPATADEIAESIIFLATDRASLFREQNSPLTEGGLLYE
jgi:hypothetical protein